MFFKQFQIFCLMILPFLSLEARGQGGLRPEGHTSTEIQTKGEHQKLSNPKAQSQKAAASMTDGQIVAILKSIHDADMEMGSLAKEQGGNRAVTTMGQQAEKDHKELNRALSNFEKKAKIKAQSNDLAQNFNQIKERKSAELEKMDKEKFDPAYLQHEIEFHKNAIEIVDASLLPNARNPELKEIVAKSRQAMLGHLQHAEYTQKTLENPGMTF